MHACFCCALSAWSESTLALAGAGGHHDAASGLFCFVFLELHLVESGLILLDLLLEICLSRLDALQFLFHVGHIFFGLVVIDLLSATPRSQASWICCRAERCSALVHSTGSTGCMLVYSFIPRAQWVRLAEVTFMSLEILERLWVLGACCQSLDRCLCQTSPWLRRLTVAQSMRVALSGSMGLVSNISLLCAHRCGHPVRCISEGVTTIHRRLLPVRFFVWLLSQLTWAIKTRRHWLMRRLQPGSLTQLVSRLQGFTGQHTPEAGTGPQARQPWTPGQELSSCLEVLREVGGHSEFTL